MNNIMFPDYFQIKEGIICHTIAESCQTGNYIIGIPKYFPILNDSCITNEKQRIINGKRYYRPNSFYQSMDILRNHFPFYLKYIPYFGEELCIFDIQKDITRIFNPKQITKQILNEQQQGKQIYKDTKLLIDILQTDMLIPARDIGVEGSIMLGGSNDESDIDMVIYGESSCKKLKKHFEKISKYENIHLYSQEDIELILSRRGKYKSYTTENELLLQEKRRTVGLVNQRRFRLQPVLGNTKIEKQERDRHLANINIIEDEFRIINDDNSYLRPSFYLLNNSKRGDISLECYDPIYMNQAKKGDTVMLRGKLYEDIYMNKKVIILGPWIFTHQYLRNKQFI